MGTLTASSLIALLFALLKNVPTLVSFLSSLHDQAVQKEQQGVGYDQAVSDGLRASHDGLLEAIAAANEADARQKATPGDAGLDQDFRRDG